MLKVYKVLLVPLVQTDKMELTEQMVLTVLKVHKALLVLPVRMDKTVHKALKVYKALLVLLVRKALSAQEAVTTRILPPLPFQEIHYKSISKTETQSLLIFLLLGVHKVLLVRTVQTDKMVHKALLVLRVQMDKTVHKALLVPLV